MIPTGAGFGIAKIIFKSQRFVNTIALKLYRKQFSEVEQIGLGDFSGEFDVFYTSLDGVRKKRWLIFAVEQVTADERAMTRRTAGGEIFIEDTHLGTASANDLAVIPKMLVHGGSLIEKKAAGHPFAE